MLNLMHNGLWKRLWLDNMVNARREAIVKSYELLCWRVRAHYEVLARFVSLILNVKITEAGRCVTHAAKSYLTQALSIYFITSYSRIIRRRICSFCIMTEPRKRSRFDQTEPELKRTSRFDRRSRSPSAKNSESRRSRSPLQTLSKSPDGGEKKKSDPAAAAAAAAARINAQIQAKKGIPHVDVPPIQSVRIGQLAVQQAAS